MMRINNFNQTSSAAATATPNTLATTPDDSRIVWGFMFENTLFTEFERRNHSIIEAAYRQRKMKHTSHHITIVDSNLPKPGKAKIYFGVAQNHLRMPGTRYYVNRQVIKSSSNKSKNTTTTSERSNRPSASNTTKTMMVKPTPAILSPYNLPIMIPSPASTFSSSSSSSLDTSFLYPTDYNNLMNSSNGQQQQLNANALAAVLSDDIPLVDMIASSGHYSSLSAENSSHSLLFNDTTEYNMNNINNDGFYSNSSEQHNMMNSYYTGLITAGYNSTQCSCYYSTNTNFDTVNMLQEDPNWVQDFVSLGLLPKFQQEVPWLPTTYPNNRLYLNTLRTNENKTTTAVDSNSLYFVKQE